jgi:hypothetical protein
MLNQTAATLDAAGVRGEDAQLIIARSKRAFGSSTAPMNRLWRYALGDRPPSMPRALLSPGLKQRHGVGGAVCFEQLVAEVGLRDGEEHAPPSRGVPELEALCATQPLGVDEIVPARAAGEGLVSDTVDRALAAVPGSPRACGGVLSRAGDVLASL